MNGRTARLIRVATKGSANRVGKAVKRNWLALSHDKRGELHPVLNRITGIKREIDRHKELMSVYVPRAGVQVPPPTSPSANRKATQGQAEDYSTTLEPDTRAMKKSKASWEAASSAVSRKEDDGKR